IGFVAISLVGAWINYLVGLTDINQPSGSQTQDWILTVLITLCFWVPLAAFFAEWLLALGPMLLTVEATTTEHALIYITLLLTMVLVYWLLPMWLLRFLGRWTVQQLENPTHL